MRALALRRETLAALADDDLALVQGAGTWLCPLPPPTDLTLRCTAPTI